ncbi:MAG: UDP-N-acetylmuramate--L-alanine ligase, partial [Clostridia bacterium]|nr:UDP-N-acetylmuramate--L-alanine ligase [Clostridia bacterium]
MNKVDTNKLSLPQRVYLVGIGGVSMSGIAEHLHAKGHHVCGSDRTPNDYTKRLEKLGIDVQMESASVSGFDLVVKTSAVKDDHK